MSSVTITANRKKLGWKFWFVDKRARVYVLWLVLVPPGFVHLYFEQPLWINWPWLATCVAGLGFMAFAMRPFTGKLASIFYAWLVPLAVGMAISFLATLPPYYALLPKLAMMWALVQAAGYILNGLVDAPSGWYWFAAVAHALVAVFCLVFPALISSQWLLMAIVSAWSLLNLWLFRSVAP